MIEIVLWVASIAMAALGIFVTAANYHAVISDLRGHPNPPSWIPLIGGCMLAVAMLIVPINGVRRYAWIPLIVDWGCAPGMLHTAVWLLTSRRR